MSMPIATNSRTHIPSNPGSKSQSLETSFLRNRKCLYLLLTLIAVEGILVIFGGLHLSTNTVGRPPSSSPEVTTANQPEIDPEIDSANKFLAGYQKYCNQTFKITPGLVGNLSSNLPPCPCIPDNLVGRYNVSFEVPPMGEMELAHTELSPGGVWEPTDCIARQHVVIIVPFRDREEHLGIFLHYMHSTLQKQLLAYRIIVVEQAQPDIFNKAMMMNVGFAEAKALGSYDCFFFHDVDMIPEDDRNMFTCSETPRHVGAYCTKFNYKVPYAEIFGGATAFKQIQFESVNGFSNQYYGWGGEDDDMFRRVKAQKLKVVRYPEAVSRYTMIKHKSDKRNPYNINSNVAWRFRPKVYVQDGLNTLKYRRRSVELRTLYTWIYAEVAHPVDFYKRQKNRGNGDSASVQNSPSKRWMVLAAIFYHCVSYFANAIAR